MDRRYNAGLYLRLSVEDSVNSAKRGRGNPFQGESASIENQRDILTKYIRLRGWDVAKVYSDDGYAGGSFNRPAFLEMVSDAEAGRIDLILVKDLSRLGRDHIEVDHYVEDLFPSLGVRFIALMDNIDSEGGADILPFRSLMNNYYLKDLSRKTKSVLHAKAKAGDYIGAFASYGYKKDPERHGRLTIDPYAADVVCRIFDLRLQRLGYRKIAAALNADGILAPRAYCYEREGREYNASKVWTEKTIKLLLENEVYLGHSVKMKKGTYSYKNKRLINKPPEDWIRAENTHPAIIDKNVWDEVQSIDLKKYDPATRKTPEPSLFSGLLVCADCGRPMICNTETHRRNGQVFKYHSYLCGTRKRTGGLCSWHTIYEKTLLRIIREDLQTQLERISVDEERVVSEIQDRLSVIALDETKKDLRRLSARLEELDTHSAKLYEDRLDGTINLDTFMTLSADVEAERNEVQAERERLSMALEKAERQVLDIDRWISGIRSYLVMDEPDSVTLRTLIDKIEIGEREGKSKGKERRQAIKIFYRFVGVMG